MERSYKFRIYPNACQQELINKTFGCVRYVYNRALADRMSQYEQTGKSDGFFEQCKTLVQWKQELAWLKEPDKYALQYALKNLDRAYRIFFNHQSDFPKFKKKKRCRNAYTTTDNISLTKTHIRLPKLGNVKCKVSKNVDGRIVNTTISRSSSGNFFVSICCADVQINPMDKTGRFVGIDLGIKDIVVTSNGDRITNYKYLIASQDKLAKLQRRLSRKTIGSNNWNKARIKVARQYEKIVNQRLDFLHKLSKHLISKYDVICIENLDINKILKNNGFAKSVLDTSWGELTRQLKYKADWYGKRIVQINRFYPSSQICNNCGYQNTLIKDLTIREWICPQCNTNHDRDINAAKNIMTVGLKQSELTLVEM